MNNRKSVRFTIKFRGAKPGEYFSIWRNGKRARMGFSDGRKWVEVRLN